jgi:signal peptide peptidase SppA
VSPNSHAIQAFMQRFTKVALIAPHDSLGLPLTSSVASSVISHLATQDDVRDRIAAEHKRNTLSAYAREANRQEKPFPYAGNGTAVIPVHGVLLNRFNYALPWVTGYNAVRSMMNAAISDPDVSRIVLDINSPGGQAAGAFELAEDIRAAREIKPVHAVVDSMAFSGGYAIASAATDITMSPSAEAGSIGVVSMHMNIGPALKDLGIEITFIYAGKHKVDGNPFEALSDEVKAAIQTDIDRIYGAFVSSVGKGRKDRMTEEQARATEAQCYGAEDCVALGLADAIMAPAAALASFEANPGGKLASNNLITSEQEKDETTMTDIAAARAEERARMSGILNSEEAKGRESLARHLAEHTDMTVEAAVAALKAAPKAEAGSDRSPLDKAMDRIEQPNVGADGPDGKKADETSDDPKVIADRVWASFVKAGGAGITKRPDTGKTH